MEKYKTILNESKCEQIINKSKFIGHAKPVESKEEADLFFAEIRKLHKSATHNVPAFVIGEQFQNQWASDDGEPQGTSGAPIVQMLVKEGITNVAIIITRYFGGVKLGTGGLVRAYTGTAKLTVEEAKLCEVREQFNLKIKIDYTYLGKFQNLAQGSEYKILDTQFMDKVNLNLATEPDNILRLKAIVADITAGNYSITSESISLIKVEI